MLIKSHAKLLYALADELLGTQEKQNSKVKRLTEDQLAEIDAKRYSKINQ